MRAVLLTFDQLSPRLLGCYGNERGGTPNSDRLASLGTLFERCYAAHADRDALRPLRDAVSRLRDEGVVTRLGVEAEMPKPDCSNQPGEIERPISTASAAEFFQLLSESSAKVAGVRSLVWVHAALDSAAANIDDWFSAILATPRDPELLVLISAVSGSPVERQLFPGAGRSRCEIAHDRIHVPMLMLAPHGRGLRLRSLTCTGDLAPTLLDWFGVDCDAASRSLLRLLDGEPPDWRQRVAVVGKRERGLLTDDFYYVESRPDSETIERRLFSKPDDVWDVHDVAHEYPEQAERLAALLARDVAAESRGAAARN